MPVLVGIAIAAIASSPAIGAALGLGASIAGTIAGDVAAALDTGVVVGDIAAGAAIGAAAGAGTAAAAGTDPGQGALWGAASGGLTAGLTPVISWATGAGDTLSQAVASGVSTAAVDAARGGSAIQALEAGALAGAGNYAGSQLFNPSTGASVPDTTAPTAAQPGVEQVTSTAPAAAPDISAALTTPPSGQKPEQVTSTAQPINPNISPYLPTSGPEQVTVTANAAPSNATTSILDMVQKDTGTQTAEKGALTAALFNLLFPQGGGQYAGTAGGATGGPGAAAGAGSPVASAAQSAQAAQVGQAGSTSAYAPGGPIFGEPAGANKYSPWNVESLRTDQVA